MTGSTKTSPKKELARRVEDSDLDRDDLRRLAEGNLPIAPFARQLLDQLEADDG